MKKRKVAVILAAMLIFCAPISSYAQELDSTNAETLNQTVTDDSTTTDQTSAESSDTTSEAVEGQTTVDQTTAGDATTDGTTTDSTEANTETETSSQGTDIFNDTITDPVTTDTDEEAGIAVQSVEAENTSNLGAAVTTTGDITIDGYYNDWSGYPESYEYNWDNSNSCWQWGVWVNGVCYKTESGTYSTDVRHKMQISCDGSYVYLHIVFAREFSSGQMVNGDYYVFSVGDNSAQFSLTRNGASITGNVGSLSPGVYDLEVRHGGGSVSWQLAEGAEGKLTVKDGNLNDELEIKIPLTELQKQNGSIDAGNIETISFYSSNLMYRKITATGTSSGPVVGMILVGGAALLGASAFYRKKRRG